MDKGPMNVHSTDKSKLECDSESSVSPVTGIFPESAVSPAAGAFIEPGVSPVDVAMTAFPPVAKHILSWTLQFRPLSGASSCPERASPEVSPAAGAFPWPVVSPVDVGMTLVSAFSPAMPHLLSWTLQFTVRPLSGASSRPQRAPVPRCHTLQLSFESNVEILLQIVLEEFCVSEEGSADAESARAKTVDCCRPRSLSCSRRNSRHLAMRRLRFVPAMVSTASSNPLTSSDISNSSAQSLRPLSAP